MQESGHKEQSHRDPFHQVQIGLSKPFLHSCRYLLLLPDLSLRLLAIIYNYVYPTGTPHLYRPEQLWQQRVQHLTIRYVRYKNPVSHHNLKLQDAQNPIFPLRSAEANGHYHNKVHRLNAGKHT